MKRYKEFIAEANNSIPSREKIVAKSGLKDGKRFVVVINADRKQKPNQDDYGMYVVNKKYHIIKDFGTHPSLDGAIKFAKNKGYDDVTKLQFPK